MKNRTWHMFLYAKKNIGGGKFTTLYRPVKFKAEFAKIWNTNLVMFQTTIAPLVAAVAKRSESSRLQMTSLQL